MRTQLFGASLLVLSLIVLPSAAFANDAKKTTRYEHHKMIKKSEKERQARTQQRAQYYDYSKPQYRRAAANYEDSRYQKWASMTAEERDLAKQRGEISYRDWDQFQRVRDAQAAQNARVDRNYRDPWQGQTIEQKDASAQRNSVYERPHPYNDGRHHPDAWQGKTAEEKDKIIQRNSVPVRRVNMSAR